MVNLDNNCKSITWLW